MKKIFIELELASITFWGHTENEENNMVFSHLLMIRKLQELPGDLQGIQFNFPQPKPKLSFAKHMSNYAIKTIVRFFSFPAEVKCEKNPKKKKSLNWV